MIGIKGNKTSKTELIENNGKYILDPICTWATVTEELNGDYSFDGTFIIDNTLPTELYDLMENDSLIYVDEEYGREYFRIAQVRKNKRSIDIFARHITISDILTLWLEDVRPTETAGNDAINWIFDNAKGNNWLTVSSNIENKSTAYYINKNVYESLFTVDNSFLNRWGGEVYRRGFNLSINKEVGKDRGVEIRSRKNLKGLEASTNLNSLCTRIYPVGFDGITINEKHIDSKSISSYSKVYSKKFKYENVKVKTEYDEEGYDTLEEAQEELKRLANLEFTQNKVDIITASYRVDFVELGKTEEYKNYSILEQTWLGDTIKVIDEEMNINISVRVTKRIYDCLNKERTSTELSNKDSKEKPPTIQDVINRIEEIPIVDENKVLFNAKEQATALINAGLKDSYVIVKPNEILVMDTKDINTAIKVWRWTNGGLGYSSTGYYGNYGTAITNDGAIVADFITTGLLNADLIKTGMLRSFNNLSWIDMNNGTFNFADRIKFDGNNFTIGNGDMNVEINEGGQIIRGGDLLVTGDGEIKTENAIMNKSELYFKNSLGGKTLSMKNGMFNLYTYKPNVGSIYMGSMVTTNVVGTDFKGMSLFGGAPCNYMDFGVDHRANTETDDFKMVPQLRLVFNAMDNTPKGVLLQDKTYLYDRMYLMNHAIMASSDRNDRIYAGNSGLVIASENNLSFGFASEGNSNEVTTYLRLENGGSNKLLSCWADLDMKGREIKNAVIRNYYSNFNVMTRSKGYKETNSIEGNNKQIRLPITANIKNGSCKVNIPNEFIEDIERYTVTGLTKFGKGDIYVSEEMEGYFIVECDSDIKFTLDLILIKKDAIQKKQNVEVENYDS